MSLWNLIRDFFVENIFGGTLSNEQIIGNDFMVGQVVDDSVNSYDYAVSGSYYVPIGKGVVDNQGTFAGNLNISLGDWLSTTFTIITLILLVLVLYIFVKWIFKLFAGLLH